MKVKGEREREGAEIISNHFLLPLIQSRVKMYKVEKCYDYPNEWSSEKDDQAFVEALV